LTNPIVTSPSRRSTNLPLEVSKAFNLRSSCCPWTTTEFPVQSRNPDQKRDSKKKGIKEDTRLYSSTSSSDRHLHVLRAFCFKKEKDAAALRVSAFESVFLYVNSIHAILHVTCTLLSKSSQFVASKNPTKIFLGIQVSESEKHATETTSKLKFYLFLVRNI
jgi:hypothetical protein